MIGIEEKIMGTSNKQVGKPEAATPDPLVAAQNKLAKARANLGAEKKKADAELRGGSTKGAVAARFGEKIKELEGKVEKAQEAVAEIKRGREPENKNEGPRAR